MPTKKDLAGLICVLERRIEFHRLRHAKQYESLDERIKFQDGRATQFNQRLAELGRKVETLSIFCGHSPEASDAYSLWHRIEKLEQKTVVHSEPLAELHSRVDAADKTLREWEEKLNGRIAALEKVETTSWFDAHQPEPDLAHAQRVAEVEQGEPSIEACASEVAEWILSRADYYGIPRDVIEACKRIVGREVDRG